MAENPEKELQKMQAKCRVQRHKKESKTGKQTRIRSTLSLSLSHLYLSFTFSRIFNRRNIPHNSFSSKHSNSAEENQVFSVNSSSIMAHLWSS